MVGLRLRLEIEEGLRSRRRPRVGLREVEREREWDCLRVARDFLSERDESGLRLWR
jgi:hypothetical protein